jgi:hypothetical protein
MSDDEGLDRETVHAIGSTIESTQAALEVLAQQLHYANTALSRARPLFMAEEKLNQLVEQARLFASQTTQEAEETARHIVAEARAEAASIIAEANRAAVSIAENPEASASQPDPLVQLEGTIDWFQELNANLVAEISDLRSLIGGSRRAESPEPLVSDYRAGPRQSATPEYQAPWSSTPTPNASRDDPPATRLSETAEHVTYPPPRFNGEDG